MHQILDTWSTWSRSWQTFSGLKRQDPGHVADILLLMPRDPVKLKLKFRSSQHHRSQRGPHSATSTRAADDHSHVNTCCPWSRQHRKISSLEVEGSGMACARGATKLKNLSHSPQSRRIGGFFLLIFIQATCGPEYDVCMGSTWHLPLTWNLQTKKIFRT